MTLKTRILIYLIGLSILDTVIPLPIVGLILVFVVLEKPPWFQRFVDGIYGV